MLAEFANGSNLTDKELNLVTAQLLYIIQEYIDAYAELSRKALTAETLAVAKLDKGRQSMFYIRRRGEVDITNELGVYALLVFGFLFCLLQK